jgi:hypothetical protein
MGRVFFGSFRDAAERYDTKDAPLPTSVASGSRQGPVRKTLICSYTGSFIAEKSDDGALNVYYIGSEPLTNMVEDAKPHPCGCGSSLDPGRMTAAKLQARNVAMRGGR